MKNWKHTAKVAGVTALAILLTFSFIAGGFGWIINHTDHAKSGRFFAVVFLILVVGVDHFFKGAK